MTKASDLSFPTAHDMNIIVALHLIQVPEACPLWAWILVRHVAANGLESQ